MRGHALAGIDGDFRHPEKRFKFNELLGNGLRCHYECATRKQLDLHKRRAKAHGHAVYSDVHVDSMVVTNMCPYCGIVLSSRECAVQHVKNECFAIGSLSSGLRFASSPAPGAFVINMRNM